MRVKEVNTTVDFKNVPDAYKVTPLGFSISPANAQFNVFVDEYEKTTSCSVGVIDFKTLSPSNNIFTFGADGTNVVEEGLEEFKVQVDLS